MYRWILIDTHKTVFQRGMYHGIKMIDPSMDVKKWSNPSIGQWSKTLRFTKNWTLLVFWCILGPLVSHVWPAPVQFNSASTQIFCCSGMLSGHITKLCAQLKHGSSPAGYCGMFGVLDDHLAAGLRIWDVWEQRRFACLCALQCVNDSGLLKPLSHLICCIPLS